MKRTPESAAFFFAPFVSSTMRIEPGWIDYNGHLNMAYYNVLFDRAVDEAFAMVGLGEDYVRERRASYFTAECHVQYKRELRLEDPVRATIQLLDFDEKRLHVYMELRHASEFWLSATSENMMLHVDLDSRKVAPFPADVFASLAIMKAAHSGLPHPEALGRVIGMPARARAAPSGVH
ncbi:thioesterase [Alsobacter metallidurans]|uniref:Thioesterase n=1 Tax=Alsobacter metallidurans TaxID=340221 RepID=A0A917IAU6_9HYPH|nr:thioesterase family protein [Alsobacter metallidurans]GGH27357.1 thioesterase [Alsobacter metallidurans]